MRLKTVNSVTKRGATTEKLGNSAGLLLKVNLSPLPTKPMRMVTKLKVATCPKLLPSIPISSGV